jgi:RHS repeat-associated protein
MQYDGNGNLTNSSVDYESYEYDDENRLTAVQVYYLDGGGNPQGWRTQFEYDGLGRLRERLEFVPQTGMSPVRPPGEGTWYFVHAVQYVYDGWRVIQERSEANAPLVSYTRGLDLSGSLEGAGGVGGLLARSNTGSSTNWISHDYYHADGNGNITCLIDGSQSVVASYRYDPYGNTISESGSLAETNVYRFSSKEIHTNSLMYYYGGRFYDPSLQRWPNRDPIEEEGGINLYAYVGNNPVNQIDPLGLTFSSNWNFFWSWVFGGGQQNRNYGPNSTETQEMENSPGGDKLRDAFYNNGCKNVNNFGYGTVQAAEDTLPHPSQWSSTALQVGGFGGASAVDNGNGTVTFTIPNVAGTHSFFYHVVPDRTSPTGPGRNINQTFQWTEPIDKSKCKCKNK